jgi:hypothetical protein
MIEKKTFFQIKLRKVDTEINHVLLNLISTSSRVSADVSTISSTGCFREKD